MLLKIVLGLHLSFCCLHRGLVFLLFLPVYRNKENLFNIIGPYFDGGAVLDLFAGSGGLGIEALSRGYEHLYSVDNQYAAFQVIKENFTMLKLANAHVYKLDYRKALKRFANEKLKFDLILLDPPYGK